MPMVARDYRADRFFSSFCLFRSRDEDVARLKAKLAQLTSAIGEEKRLRAESDERLTKEATEQVRYTILLALEMDIGWM